MAGQDARLYRDSDQMEPIAPSFLPFEPPLRVLLTRMYFQANSNPVGRGFVHPARETSFLAENRVSEGAFSNPLSTKWEFRFLNRSELEEGGRREGKGGFAFARDK